MHAADPDDPDLAYMIALEHAKADDPDAAIGWLDKALALKPTYHYAYFQKAKMQSELGEDDDALATLDTGHRLGQRDLHGDAKALGELQELRAAMARVGVASRVVPDPAGRERRPGDGPAHGVNRPRSAA